jgi:hypothetical protein
MMSAPLTPESDGDDLTAALATQLRVAKMSFEGGIEDIEERAFNILWRAPSTRGGYSYNDIKPRLAAAIDIARRLGSIDLELEIT